MSENLDKLPMWRSAFRRGITGSDIGHAIRMRIKTLLTENEMIMIIGPARSGAMLEIGFGRTGVIVHAMLARRKFWP